MKMCYQIFKNRGLLVYKLSGEWSIGKYKEYVSKILKDPGFKYVTKVLSDLRELNMPNEVFNELDELAKIRKESIMNKYMNVHLVSSPSSTAITHLYNDKLSDNGYSYNYCSTIKKAIELLNLEETEIEMEQLIQNLISKY